MSNSLERRKKLEERRAEILSTTTKEERVKNMSDFIESLTSFGEKYFPNGQDNTAEHQK